jgi:hypothetical protein
MSVKVFYHIYCNGYTERVVHDQLTKLTFSGLYHTADRIFCFITGDPIIIERVVNIIRRFGPKYTISKKIANDTTYERFTLTEIPAMIRPDDNILYFHSKGIMNPTNDNIYDWRTYMEYFMFSQHKMCLHLLDDEYDIVGVNLQENPAQHYSGNFWWCKGAYFLTLDLNALETVYLGSTYLAPEMFICSKNPRVYSLFNSIDKNHYYHAFPICEYINGN